MKVDLQALTVGVAVLSMAAWLDSAKKTLQEEQPGSAGSLMARKLAIVNGLGEHSRAQVLAIPSADFFRPLISMRPE